MKKFSVSLIISIFLLLFFTPEASFAIDDLNSTMFKQKIDNITKDVQQTAQTLNSVNSNSVQKAPISPDFIYSMEKTKYGTALPKTADGHVLGLINPPTKYYATIPASFLQSTSLPPSYDLRNESKITSVKNQESCGSCWAFATYGSIESTWLANGHGTFDLSENNLNYGHEFELSSCAGGNMNMASAYLTRGDGPISETDDPFESTTGSYHEGLSPQAIVTQAQYLPVDDDDFIKQMIYDNGALFTNLHVADPNSGEALDDYMNEDYTYYYYGDESTNHAVTLAGWDDNKVVAGAPGNGAWIIKNSWGSSWGENGYFYVSYYDTEINSSVGIWTERIDYDASIVISQYDKLGYISALGFGDNTDYGLVKFLLNKNQTIERIGTWIGAAGNVCFEIYDDFNGSNLSNLITSTSVKSCDYPGYYSFELDSEFSVNTDDDIYVKVEYNTPDYTSCIPIEAEYSGYASPEIASEVFWVSTSGGNGTWLEIGNQTASYKYDPCVKVYGSTSFSADFTADITSGAAPLTVNFTDLSIGSPTSWSWSFGDGVSSSIQSPTHVYENNDSYTVSLTVSDGVDSDIEIKSSYINISEVALPIELDSYKAIYSEGVVSITWETATETNNAHFLIYRNENVIASIEGAGTTSKPHSYEYTDDQIIPGNTYTYILADISYANEETKYTNNAVTITVSENDIPLEFALEANYPNPFNPTTAIGYELAAVGDVELSIFDMNGRKVATLVNGSKPAGYHSVNWDASNVSSGIYFYRLQAGDFIETKKMVFIK
jgi:C1A family cysteine protease